MKRLAPVAALLLASCCFSGGGPPLTRYSEDLTGAQILETLRVRQARIPTLVAEGKGSLSGSHGSDGSFRWQCWAQGTSHLRLTLTHRMKGCLADAVIEGDRVSCYDPEAGVIHRGLLKNLTLPGLAQTASLIRLLAGPGDALAFDPTPSMSDEPRLLLDLGAGARWKLRMDRRFLILKSAELSAYEGSGGILARVAFDPDRYRMVSEVPWPMEMTVDRPGESWKLMLKFQETRLGEPIDPSVFKLKVPDGTRTVDEGTPAP